MVILYTAPSCTSCRKAKAWLQTHDIDFQEHNLFTEPLSIEKIKQILQLTESGTEEIISTRSKAFQQLNVDINDLSLNELFDMILVCYVDQLCLMRSGCKLVTMRTRFAASCHEEFGH